MIRKLLATTALASIVATGAFAQDTTTAPAAAPAPAAGSAATDTAAPAATTTAETTAAPAGGYLQRVETDQYLVSQLDGLNVYQSAAADAASAGEIENLLLDKDGKVLAAVIDTSGLDDDKTVAVPFDKITWSNDQNNQPRAVLTATREELTAAPEFSDEDAEDVEANGAMAPGAGTAMAPDAGTAPAAGTAAAPADTAANGTAMAPATTTATTAPADTAASGTAMAPATTTAAATDANGYMTMAAADQYLSDDIIGEKVYSGPAEDAASVGDVNDLVLGKDGKIAAAVIGVGGFLGLGEKNVAVPFGELQMAMDEDGDDVRPVLAATKEQLTAAPTFETRSTAETAANTVNNGAATAGAAAGTAAGTVAATADNAGNTVAGAANTATTNAENSMATTAPGTADTTTTASTTADNGRASMTPATGSELTSERLVGTTVYGPDDKSIGKVGDIALTAEGQVDAIIVDVGGFLGLGEKPVAVAMDNLQFMKDSGGSLYLYTQFTEDQLKAAPEYNRDTYAENRATMRIEPGAKLPAATDDGAAAPAPAPAQ